MNENMIHRLSLDLELSNDIQELQVTKDVNELYQHCFQPAVEDVIEKYGSRYALLIDKIDIDLGVVEKKDIQNLLSIRLEEEIKKRLKNNRHDTNTIQEIDEFDSDEYINNEHIRRRSHDFALYKEWNDKGEMSEDEQIMYYLKENKIPWYIENEEFDVEKGMELFVRKVLQNQSKMQDFFDIFRNDKFAFYRFIDLVKSRDLFEIDKMIVSSGMCTTNGVTSLFKKICNIDEVVEFFCLSDEESFVAGNTIAKEESRLEDVMSKEGSQVEEELLLSKRNTWEDYSYEMAKRARKGILQLLTACLFEHIPSDQNILSMLQQIIYLIKVKYFRLKRNDAPSHIFEGDSVRNTREDERELPLRNEGRKDMTVSNESIQQMEEMLNSVDQRHNADDEENELISGKDRKVGGLITDEVMQQKENLVDSIKENQTTHIEKESNDLIIVGKEIADTEKNAGGNIQQIKDLLYRIEEKLQDGKQQIKIQPEMLESLLGEERLHIEDVGLVILHPFLTAFFDTLKMLDSEKKQFVSISMQERACHLLKYMTGYRGPHYGHLLMLEKMMCGLPFTYPISKDFKIRPEEEQEINNLLSAVCQHWKPLKGSTTESLQRSFILRHGTLEYADSAWIVRVEGSAIDILLEDLPWEISTILFAWLEPMIFVEWQME